MNLALVWRTLYRTLLVCANVHLRPVVDMLLQVRGQSEDKTKRENENALVRMRDIQQLKKKIIYAG